MEPFTTSSPSLVPSWGTALPLATISLLAADFYNISLWTVRHGDNCINAQRNGWLRPVKWNWQYIESSHWYQWRFAYPGTYCLIVAPFECLTCPTTLSGPFLVTEDTSEEGACCHHGKIHLKATRAHHSRVAPLLNRSVSIRLTLNAFGVQSVQNHRCKTRFYVELFNTSPIRCNHQSTFPETQMIAADEFILDKDLRIHGVPINLTHLCAKITPRCDECAFACPTSFRPVALQNLSITPMLPILSKSFDTEESTNGRRDRWMLVNCAGLWLVMTLLSLTVISVISRAKQIHRLSLARFNRRTRLASIEHSPLIERHSVVHIGHFD